MVPSSNLAALTAWFLPQIWVLILDGSLVDLGCSGLLFLIGFFGCSANLVLSIDMAAHVTGFSYAAWLLTSNVSIHASGCSFWLVLSQFMAAPQIWFFR